MLQVGSSNYEIQTFTVGRMWKYANNDFVGGLVKWITFVTLLHWVSKEFKAQIQFGSTDVG